MGCHRVDNERGSSGWEQGLDSTDGEGCDSGVQAVTSSRSVPVLAGGECDEVDVAFAVGTIEENMDPKFKIGVIDPSGEHQLWTRAHQPALISSTN